VTDAFGREMFFARARSHSRYLLVRGVAWQGRVHVFAKGLIDQSLRPMMRLDRDDFGSNRPESLNEIGANSAENARG
jgi:hypothetical protein